MNDLLKRTLTGAVYVASVLAAICFNPIISSIYFGIIGIIVALVMPGMLESKTLMNFLQIKEMFYHVG